MNRDRKSAIVEAYEGIFNEAGIVVFSRQSGMTVSEFEDLRARARKEDAQYQVTRNSQLRLALRKSSFPEIADQIKGPIGITWSKDPLAAARVMASFSQGNRKMELVAGGMSKKMLQVNELEHLASLPPLEALRGKIIGLILAPGGRIASVLQQSAARVPLVLRAYSEKAS